MKTQTALIAAKKKTEYCRVIAFAQHKGGVGKTTTTINVGAALAGRKYKVLLIDMDPQANMTSSLGIGEHPGIVEAFAGETVKPLQIEQLPNEKRTMDILPASLDLAGTEVQLINAIGREFMLKEIIKPLRRDYDFILIDCPPSLGLLTINALTAADFVYLPIQSEYLAIQGLGSILNVISMIKKQLNKALKIGGGIITRYDARKVLNREAAQAVKEKFNLQLLDTRIRENIAIAEAPIHGKTIFQYDDKSNGAQDYANIAAEIEHETAHFKK